MAMAKESTDYKSLSAELDAIIESMQTADLDIEEAVTQYERGMKIIEQLATHLKTAENRVTKVKANWKDKV